MKKLNVNIKFNCNIDDKEVINKVTKDIFNEVRKKQQEELKKLGFDIFVTVDSIFNKNNEYDPKFSIKLEKINKENNKNE